MTKMKESGIDWIGQIPEEWGVSRLKYYFDISDTRQTRFYRPVPIWELKEEYEEEVINTLKDNFGPLDNENDLAQAVLSASGNVVEDNISDYLKELLYCKTDSFLCLTCSSENSYNFFMSSLLWIGKTTSIF